MKRSHLIAIIALAAVVLVAAVVSVTVFSRRVQVITGTRVECTYGHLVSEDIETIKVRPSEASEYGVKTTTIVCPDHRKAEKLYDEAQAALAKGDYPAAKARLAEVLALDSGFKSAGTQLAELDAGKKPKPATDTGAASTGGSQPGGGKPGTGSSDESSTPTGPIASLAGWMPADLVGFTADDAIADALSISREYVESGGDATLVISAEQIGGSAATQDALRSRVRLPYDQDAKKVTIGTRTGWVGTDGRSVAVLGLTDGPVLVVFQLSTPKDDPKGSVGRLVGIAEGLPR